MTINTAAVARIAGRPGTSAHAEAKAMLDSAWRNSAEMVALRAEVARLKGQVEHLQRENDALISRLASATA
jgi:hypothetical protein